MELQKNYNPSEVESKWYEYWNNHHLFASKPDSREPYTIVIPPPKNPPQKQNISSPKKSQIKKSPEKL